MNLRIELRRSRRLIALIVLSHLGALAVLGWLDIAPVWRIVLGAAILSSLALQWKKQARPGANALVALQVSEDGEWSLRRAGAALDEPASLLSHFSHPAAIVLRLGAQPGRAEPVILMPDTQDAETLRQLRVRLAALRRERNKGTG